MSCACCRLTLAQVRNATAASGLFPARRRCSAHLRRRVCGAAADERAEAAAQLSKPREPLPVALYLVPTPIGNLEDITLRALRVLRQADAVFAEDCRHTLKLLSHYGISAPLRSYHQHNESTRSAEICNTLARGLSVALVSDAGSPGISDPGEAAVAAAIAAGHDVVALPGPAAVITGLVASGLSTKAFAFFGFLPPKSGARRARLSELRARIMETMVFYAPPHGLLDVLADMIAILGPDRRCCIARELTKVHESYQRGTLAELHAHFSSAPPRGEVTVIVHGSTPDELRKDAHGEVTPQQQLQKLLQEGYSVNAASKAVSAQFGIRKKEVYALAINAKDSAASEDESQ